MYTTLIAVTILGFTSAWSPPAFCGTSSCPPFTQVGTNPIERQYGASNWVSTREIGSVYATAVPIMFARLSDYIDGANMGGIRLPSTVPVIIKVTHDVHDDFEMSFFLDVGSPPAPTASGVYLTQRPANNVFVEVFGGLSTASVVSMIAVGLMTQLSALSLPFNAPYFHVAIYNPPSAAPNIYNEIWVARI